MSSYRHDLFKAPKEGDVKSRCSRPEVFCKKVFLKILQNSQENACARASYLIELQALAQVIFCKICRISKKPFL